MSSLIYIPGPAGLSNPRIRIMQLDSESSVSFPPTVNEITFNGLSMEAYEAIYGGTQTGLFRYRLTSGGETTLEDTGYIYLSGRGDLGIRDHGGPYAPQVVPIEMQTQGIGIIGKFAYAETVNNGFVVTGDFTDTFEADANQFVLNDNPDVVLNINAGSGRYIKSLTFRGSVSSASRACNVKLFNYETSVFDLISTIDTTSLTTKEVDVATKYTEAETGEIQVQFDGSPMNSGDVLTIDLVEAGTLSSFGEVLERIGGFDRAAGESVKNGVNVLTNSDKVGYNVTTGQVDDVINPVTCGGGSVNTVTGNVNGSVGSVVAGVTVSTNNDKNGYNVTSGQIDDLVNPVAVDAIGANTIGSSQLATSGIDEIRDAITGGAYPLDTDANGRIRVVDGTGNGEIDLTNGKVRVGANDDKTGYNVTTGQIDDVINPVTAGGGSVNTVTGNVNGDVFGSVGSVASPVTVGTNTDKTGYNVTSGQIDDLVNPVAVDAIGANTIGSSQLASSGVNEIRDAITGGAYPLDTDSNGRVRVVDGTDAGEIDLSSGKVRVGTNDDKTGYNVTTGQVDDVINPVTCGGGSIGTVTGNVNGSVGSVAADVGINMSQSIPGTPLNGTTGQALDLIRDNVDETISSRASQSSVDAFNSDLNEILDRIGSFSGSGNNTILGFFRALMRNDAGTPTDLGGSYDQDEHSNQAIGDQVDSNLTFILDVLGPFSGGTTNSVFGFLRALMRDDLGEPTDLGGTYAADEDSLEALRTKVNTLSDFDPLTDDVNVGSMNNDVIGANQIAANAITSGKINSGAITSSKIASNAITSSQIAADAITATKIAAGAITSNKIAADAIGATQIATNAIGSAEFSKPAVDKIVAAVYDALTTDFNTPATFGELLNLLKTRIDVTLSTRASQTSVNNLNNISTSQVKAQVDQALSDIHLDHLLSVATTFFPGNSGSILGEMLERITTWRFVQEALSEAPSGGGGGTDWSASEKNQIRQALGLTGTTAATTGSGNLDQVQTDVENLNDFNPSTEQVTVATNNDKTGYSISGTKTTLDSLNDLNGAAVKSQVVSALSSDTYGEPSSVPGASSSLAAKIGWLFALARNKITQTAAIQRLKNDGGGGDIATAAVDDDGATTTREEWQ